MRLREILSEAKFRKPAVMFHGTSSVFLREILKKGLDPNPKSRVYDKDADIMGTGLSKQTLGGIYFSKTFRVANGAAYNAATKFGGNSLIVIAQIAEQSSFADEDMVSNEMLDAYKAALGIQHSGPNRRVIEIVHNSEAKQKAVEEFTNKVHESLSERDDMPIQWPGYGRVFNLITAFYIEQILKDDPSLNNVYRKELKDLVDSGIDYRDGTNSIRVAQDMMSRRYKDSVYIEPGEWERFHALRVTEPVTFSGSNRILSIVELGKKHNDPIKIHYGNKDTVLKHFKPSYENTMGEFPGFVD